MVTVRSIVSIALNAPSSSAPVGHVDTHAPHDTHALSVNDEWAVVAARGTVKVGRQSLGQVLRHARPTLFEGVAEYRPNRDEPLYGSTDVGDVSWVTPTAQCWVACFAFGTPMHSWQLVAQGKTGMAHAGLRLAARALAATALRLFDDPALLQRAREELEQRRGGPYVCPIPPEATLPAAA